MPAWAPIPYFYENLSPIASHYAKASTYVAQVDHTLVVEFQTQKINLEDQTVTYEGDVVARFGPTVLRAPSLVLSLKDKEGLASGGVRIEDPLGVLQAQKVIFNWQNRTGVAEEVALDALEVVVEAARVDIGPKEWTLHQVRATACTKKKPDFHLLTSKVTLKPGRSGRTSPITLELFGKKVVTLPGASFSLDPRVRGFSWPAISYKQKVGFGVSWNSGFAMGDHAAISAQHNTFPGMLPSYGLELAWSGVAPSRTRSAIQPQSDLGERFSEGFFENIAVETPESEHSALRQPRLSLSMGTLWNQTTKGRPEDFPSISKRLDFAAEFGGLIGNGAGKLQVRLQDIRATNKSAFRKRALIQGTLHSGLLPLGRSWQVFTRIDGFGTQGSADFYGWLRGQAGLTFRPNSHWRLGSSVSYGGQTGRPMFAFDGLERFATWNLRADFHSGPYTVRAMMKYDLRRLEWFDREYSVALKAGCFEPFMIARQEPSEFRFGFRLSLDSFFEKLQNREQRR